MFNPLLLFPGPVLDYHLHFATRMSRISMARMRRMGVITPLFVTPVRNFASGAENRGVQNSDLKLRTGITSITARRIGTQRAQRSTPALTFDVTGFSIWK